MPTSEWNAATSSGIDVIGTRRAITAPMLPPMAMPRITSSQPMPSAGGCAASVVTTAIPMPIMPKKLPCRDEAGLDSPRSDRMNRTPATRYSTAARLAFMTRALRHARARPAHPSEKNESCEARWIAGPSPAMTTTLFEKEPWPSSLLFPLVHREHALRHQKAAENIHRCEDQRDEAEAPRPRSAAADHGDPDREQRTDHDHRGDRVGHRHQRRMQRRGYRPHHEIADKHGENENRQPEHKGIDGLRDMIHGGSPDAVLSAFGLKIRVNHRAVPGQRGGLDQFVVPLHRQRLG